MTPKQKRQCTTGCRESTGDKQVYTNPDRSKLPTILEPQWPFHVKECKSKALPLRGDSDVTPMWSARHRLHDPSPVARKVVISYELKTAHQIPCMVIQQYRSNHSRNSKRPTSSVLSVKTRDLSILELSTPHSTCCKQVVKLSLPAAY